MIEGKTIEKAVALAERGDHTQSLELLRRALSEARTDADRAEINACCAQSYEKLGDRANCREHCERAIAQGYKGAYPYKQLIISYLQLHRFSDALRVCDTALEKEGGFDPQVRNDIRAYAHAWKEIIEYAEERKLQIERMLGKE